MLELVFVIVIMGIIGKFGVEFLAQAYKSFIYTKVNHTLQANSTTAVEFISTRLQHRIKDSIIARIPGVQFDALADVNTSKASQYTVLEWISTDIDGFRGDSNPYWSGIADLDAVGAGNSLIISPQTNTTDINTLIDILSGGSGTSIDNAAIYFIGSNSDITLDYGWDTTDGGAYMQDQNGSMHPIQDTANPNELAPLAGTFSTISEYYKLSWTANAIVLSSDGNLTLHSDYQPWEGDSYTAATKQDLLMQNVDTFQFMAIGSIVKIQVCVKTDIINGDATGGYSLCKEKTIY